MRKAVALLASTRTTLLLAAALGACLLPFGAGGGATLPVLPVFALLALNLAAAIAVHRKLRRGALGLFHAALLAGIVVGGWGQAMRFAGRVEVVAGTAFDAALVAATARGAWHGDGLARVVFVQGPLEVDYRPGLRRGHTRSTVLVRDETGTIVVREVGDDTPLVLDGFRFYTTSNKGYAVMATWQPDAGPAVRGSVNMPSFPFYDWKQTRPWTPPGGPALTLTLAPRVAPDSGSAWRFAPDTDDARLLIEGDGVATELEAGTSVRVPGGRVRFDGVRGWVGYTIHYDPALHALFALALLAAGALGWHVAVVRLGWRLPHPRILRSKGRFA